MTSATQTRDRLILAARDLFLVQGYHATGVAQIVKSAGVNPGSLYHFFPTKEDLLLAVLEWYRDNIYEGLLAPIFERIDDPIERVFGILDGYRQVLLMMDFEYGCPIGNLTLELSTSHPKARALIVENFDNWESAIRSCLEAAKGRLPEDLDLDGLTTLTLTTMEGAVMLAKAHRSLDPFDRAVHALRRYYDTLLEQGTDWASAKT